jgi:anti-sigma regulatory factor (Ser/Thr protein kinase)
MTPQNRTHPDYSHGLLVHDSDEELVEGTRAFVARGLASSGHVLVHGTKDRVALLREALGTHPRLEYGFDEELYLDPTQTLFAYQRRLAERTDPGEFWVTGTVPLGGDSAAQAAWNRYESAVDEALARYPFRALCVYDTRTRPAAVIAAARATHRTLSIDLIDQASPDYVDPTAFLTHRLAQVPAPPTSTPSVDTTITDPDDLRSVRHQFASHARSESAVPSVTVDHFLLAVHEVVGNGLIHGSPPVRLTLWTDLGSLTCRVEDSGPGSLDPMTGFRHPGRRVPGRPVPRGLGLWAARQLVDDLFIGNSPSGGCSVLMTAT